MEVAKNTAFKNMKAALAKQSSDGFSNIVMNKGKYVVKNKQNDHRRVLTACQRIL